MKNDYSWSTVWVNFFAMSFVAVLIQHPGIILLVSKGEFGGDDVAVFLGEAIAQFIWIFGFSGILISIPSAIFRHNMLLRSLRFFVIFGWIFTGFTAFLWHRYT